MGEKKRGKIGQDFSQKLFFKFFIFYDLCKGLNLYFALFFFLFFFFILIITFFSHTLSPPPPQGQKFLLS